MYDSTKPYKHQILKLIKSTWHTPHVRIRSGTYPIIVKRFSGLEIQHSDGIGTKGVYHLRKRTFKNAVIDAFAMNANDLAMVGAVPYALQDHIVIPDAGHTAILEIVRELSTLCRKHKIAITGGETSHHDNLDALDIGITMSGFLRRVRTNRVQVGDVLIGIKSNGLHSNGFTKVRGLFGAQEWRDDFVRPTAIYLDTIQAISKRHTIHSMMHITGGAFTKLKDILSGADAFIKFPHGFKLRPIFTEMYGRGVSSKEMYSTLNCGIGFVLSVPRTEAEKILSGAKDAYCIGEVRKGSGKVRITSIFDGSVVVL